MTVGQYTIEEIDVRTLSDDEIVELNAFDNILRAEARPEDPPRPLELTIASLRNLPDSLVLRAWFVRDTDGTLIGEGITSHHDTEDNKHLLDVSLHVLPEWRRRGIGTELLQRILAVGEEIGRNTFFGSTSERIPAGEAFATKFGARAGLREHTNRLLIADVDTAMVDRWVAEGPGRAPGYSMLSIDGPYHDDLLEQIVSLHMVMNTAPRDDLDMEDWVITPKMMRDWERSMMAGGDQRWSLFVRHDASGEFVGFTELAWNPALPKVAHQWGTGVRPEHRGYALGKWLKAANIQRVVRERPEVEEIRTGNADSNDPMLGINTQLGFKPFISHTVWQVTADEVRATRGA